MAILLIRHLWTDGLQGPPGTIHEAVAIAHAKGFCCISDELNGIPRGILVVSKMPLTREQAADLRVNSPGHPGWRGVVKIYGNRNGIGPKLNYDPTCSVFWGDLFVYGDPEVIRGLTGKLP